MKAAEIKRLAEAHDQAALDAAADRLAEGEALELVCEGADEGEKLTHLMLASRVRARIEAGEDPKAAFRAVMGDVRDLLANG